MKTVGILCCLVLAALSIEGGRFPEGDFEVRTVEYDDQIVVYERQSTACRSLPAGSRFSTTVTIVNQQQGQVEAFVNRLKEVVIKNSLINDTDLAKLLKYFAIGASGDDSGLTNDNVRHLVVGGDKEGSEKFYSNLVTILAKRNKFDLLKLLLELAMDNGSIDMATATKLANKYDVPVTVSSTVTAASSGAPPAAAPTAPVAAPAPTSPATKSQIKHPEQLNGGDCLVSPNGAYSACMQTCGNLVVYLNPVKVGNARWWTDTACRNDKYSLIIKADNNLIVQQEGVGLRFESKSGGKGTGPSTLKMQDDGNLVLYDVGNLAVWASKGGVIGTQNLPNATAKSEITAPAQVNGGDCLVSPNGVYQACMQKCGNFVVYKNGVVAGNHIWYTDTICRPSGTFAMILQMDNNLVLKQDGEKVLWQAQTYNKGPGPCRLIMQDDSNLVIYNGANIAVWSTIGGLIGPVGK